jgi:hypothetical protein
MIDAVAVKSEENQQTSHTPLLLTLPPELRDRIYELVIIDDDDISVGPRHPLPRQGYWQAPALLQSCRQIRSEAYKLYFARNKFRIGWLLDGDCFPSLEGFKQEAYVLPWLHAIGADVRDSLREIRLDDTMNSAHDWSVAEAEKELKAFRSRITDSGYPLRRCKLALEFELIIFGEDKVREEYHWLSDPAMEIATIRKKPGLETASLCWW